MEGLDLEPLIERCRGGDALAWEAVVRETQPRVFGMALRFMRSREEASDAAQEAYIRAWSRLDRYKGGEFLPWLLRLTRNVCIDLTRRKQARPPAEDVALDDGTLDLAGGDEAPDVATERSSRATMLRRAIAGLGQLNREIVLLKEIEGFNFREIAEMLGVPIGTVKSRSHRARGELAAKLIELDPTIEEGVSR